jgi:carbonic anhydrase/acetyltransferase-like protein (isoleucine patch superfamily)
MPSWSYKDLVPKIEDSVWIAPSAWVTGDVTIGKESSIFFGVSIRGDIQPIVIGEGTNIQDNAVIHTSVKRNPCKIGNGVTVGHSAIIHGAVIKDHSIVGMGSIILDDAVIGENSLIGAGSLVTQGTTIPPKTLAFGNPCRVVRALTDKEIEETFDSARRYIATSRNYFNAMKRLGY